MEPADSFIHFLQSCISPIALITGVGLILLSTTNRLGRTIDRTRQIMDELHKKDSQKKELKLTELKILFKRNRTLKTSIASISLSFISTSLIIPVLLVMNLYSIDFTTLGISLLIVSITTIVVASVFLFFDVLLTLKALKMEAKEFLNP